MNIEAFFRNYWNYFLELENQFIATKRYVEFDKQNENTYSIEYLKLYQAVCSEIDVIGKELAQYADNSFVVDNRTNIKKWGYVIQKYYQQIDKSIVIFDGTEEIQPLKNWVYEKNEYIDTNNRRVTKFRIVGNKKTIQWWNNYNTVKHQRVALIIGKKNFQLANQKNLKLAFAALYIFERLFLKGLLRLNDNGETVAIKESKLFKLKNE